ncbi:hypothetical protein [Flavisphingomonas formosensis]|uniref:hypothetical protein n=1 Tax=Flavisphingomonas formosensis TaxID=861534 RepID=UPI0012F92AC5|nr:hypothetical protein [Sphingomonas formosensis]
MKTLLPLSAALAAAFALAACHKGGDIAGNVADVAADANATAAEAISDTNAAESDDAATLGNGGDAGAGPSGNDTAADNGN